MMEICFGFKFTVNFRGKPCTQNLELTLRCFPKTQNLKENGFKSEKDCFTPSKHSRVCAEHFTEDSSEQNIAVRSFVGTLFHASPTCTQKRRRTGEFYLPHGKLQAASWAKTTKNKSIIPAEERTNFSAISQTK